MNNFTIVTITMNYYYFTYEYQKDLSLQVRKYIIIVIIFSTTDNIFESSGTIKSKIATGYSIPITIGGYFYTKIIDVIIIKVFIIIISNYYCYY